jgi:hypothetical protein
MWRRASLTACAVLALGGAQACVFGPTPREYAATLPHLPPLPVCSYAARDIALVAAGGVVTCKGSATVNLEDLRHSAVAEATSVSSGGPFVVISERIEPLADVGGQCEAVPLFPWSRHRMWRQNVCSVVPVSGIQGHVLQLDVQFPAPAGASSPLPSPLHTDLPSVSG